MLLNHRTVSLKWFLVLMLPCAGLVACHKKNDLPIPVQKSSKPSEASVPQPETGSDSSEISNPDIASAVPNSASGQTVSLSFTSHPVTQAWIGRTYSYRPSIAHSGAYKRVLVKGPDSMRVNSDGLDWMPTQVGNYSVILTALLEKSTSNEKPRQAKQEFSITVNRVLELALKPISTQVNKGDTVSFDFRASTCPVWAANEVKARIDFDGDGKWDTTFKPWDKNQIIRKVYEVAGNYSPKFSAQYKDQEIQNLSATVSVVSAVNAIFTLRPDTVEPGGPVTVDASGSEGDGRLIYSLDLDGDGTQDWTDSTSGKCVVPAPKSGMYQAGLSVRNPMGQEGHATQALHVNAKVKLEVKVKNPKENMATDVEFRVHAMDADDSLVKSRINYTGDSLAWVSRSTPPDSVLNAKNWLLRFRHAYGKVGKYTATICVSSSDGRETCNKNSIEIFNAMPICIPGPDLHATLGQPISIEGSGVDPDGKIVKWEWDLNGDGKFDLASASSSKFQYTFSKLGIFPMVLRVTSEDGKQATATRKVEVRKKWKA